MTPESPDRHRRRLHATVTVVASVVLGAGSLAFAAVGASSSTRDGGPPPAPSAAATVTAGPDAVDTVATTDASPTAPRPAAVAGFSPGAFILGLRTSFTGLVRPVFVTGPGDRSGDFFIVEQAGRIIRVRGTGRNTFLDIRARVNDAGGEQGLLGLAFHPGWPANPRLYVAYTNNAGGLVISEFRRATATTADPASERILLKVSHPTYQNHNGGMIAFGPDGDLYIGTGDGGGSGDTLGNAQNPAKLNGKLLRIDVDHGTTYAIPPGNPFVGRTGYRPEIWALGLRNPWRWSFDRSTGAMYVADVGQDHWEELDTARAGVGGQNDGWNIMEGTHCYNASSCTTTGLTRPVLQISHSTGDCAIVGGYVYRGTLSPLLVGGYLFGDLCSGRIYGVSAAAALAGPVTPTVLLDTGISISSFGQADTGELYVVGLDGIVRRIVATAR